MDVDNQDKKDGRCLIVKSRTNKVVVIEQLSQDKSIPKLKNIESVHHEEASHNTRHNKLDWQALQLQAKEALIDEADHQRHQEERRMMITFIGNQNHNKKYGQEDKIESFGNRRTRQKPANRFATKKVIDLLNHQSWNRKGKRKTFQIHPSTVVIDGLPDTTSFPAQVANKIFSRVSNSCEVFFEREESPSRIQIVEVNPQEYLRNTYSNNNMKTIESREKLGGWEETKKQAPASRGILRCRPKNIGFMSMGQKRTTEKQNTNFVSFNVSRLNIRSNRHLSQRFKQDNTTFSPDKSTVLKFNNRLLTTLNSEDQSTVNEVGDAKFMQKLDQQCTSYQTILSHKGKQHTALIQQPQSSQYGRYSTTKTNYNNFGVMRLKLKGNNQQTIRETVPDKPKSLKLNSKDAIESFDSPVRRLDHLWIPRILETHFPSSQTDKPGKTAKIEITCTPISPIFSNYLEKDSKNIGACEK